MTSKKRLIPSLLLLMMIISSAYSQPELDTTFNFTGKQFTTGGFGYGMLVQADNKVVVFGRSSDDAGSFGLVRYNENGSLDETFGIGGIVTTDFDNMLNDAAFGGAIQNDGKIVLVGVTSFNAIGLGNFALARYNSDGSLDSSFGSAGKVVTNVQSSGEDEAKSILIQPDGKLVVVGHTLGSDPDYQVIVRYNNNGTLDPTFGNAGIVRTVISGHSIWGNSVAIQTDGKLLIGGGMQTVPAPPTATFSYTLTRLNPDGTRDNSFDGDGFKSILYGIGGGPGELHIRAIGVQQDGRITAAGWDSVLFRFNSNGSPDTSFDGDGTLRPVLNGGTPKSILLSASGKITVAGTTSGDFAIARYKPDGSLDTAFSTDGYLSVDVDSGASDMAAAVKIDSFGRIVIGGASNARYAAVRLEASPAGANLSGRVTRRDRRPFYSATVYLDDGTGAIRVGRTNPFGYYRFIGVAPRVYTITVAAKGGTFAPRTIGLFDDLSDVDFVEEP